MRQGVVSGLGTSLVLVTSIEVGALLWPAETTRASDAAGRHGEHSLGFGQCVAGSYLGTVTVVDPPELAGLTFATLGTAGADGTYVVESTVDFSAGGSTPYAFRSSGRGNWRRIGPNKVKLTYLHFNYDATGLLMGFEKIDSVLTYERGCESGVGQGATFSIYLPTQDPFGAEPPIFSGKADASFKRMPVQ